MNNPSFETMRAAMIVSQLRTTGVNAPRILAAMGSVPREDYVEADRRNVAYADIATPAGSDRALLPPEVLGQLLENAELHSGEKALVIGGATGYSAAVLAASGLNVTLLESDAGLAARARTLLGNSAIVVEGDLRTAAVDGGPFDFILVDGAVEDVPQNIVDLLHDDGRLAMVRIDSQGVGRAAIGIRSGNAFGVQEFADAPAAVRLPGFDRARTFKF